MYIHVLCIYLCFSLSLSQIFLNRVHENLQFFRVSDVNRSTYGTSWLRIMVGLRFPNSELLVLDYHIQSQVFKNPSSEFFSTPKSDLDFRSVLVTKSSSSIQPPQG